MVGKETCCSFSGNPAASFCTSRKPSGVYQNIEQSICYTNEDNSSINDDWDAWGDLTMATCDDSSDCRPGLTCRNSWLHPSGTKLACGTPTSGHDEMCVPESPCRTKKTLCQNGRCVIPPDEALVKCDTLTCFGEKPICCVEVDGVSCTNRASCNTSQAYACTSPSQCPSGQFCIQTLMGSQCGGQIACGHQGVFCDADRDCRRVPAAWHTAYPNFHLTKARCASGPEPWLKRCEFVE